MENNEDETFYGFLFTDGVLHRLDFMSRHRTWFRSVRK